MDTGYTDKEAKDAKQVRHLLGLGNLEAKAVFKKTQVHTVRDLVLWYHQKSKESESKEALDQELQYAIVSSQKTEKFISLLMLLGRRVCL